MRTTTRRVRIVTDSAADLPQGLAAGLGITVVPLLVHMDGQSYRDGVDLTGEEFYDRLSSTQSVTTTSLPSLESFAAAYRELNAAGFDVLSIHLSSKLSGTFNAALMASTADGVQPETVEVLDSRTLSMAQGWIAVRAAEMARQGASLDEVSAYALSLVPRVRLYGLLDSLEHVMRSGRVRRLPGTVGTLLKIKPILTIRPDGEAVIEERIRTRSRAVKRLLSLTAELGPLDALAVVHGDDTEGATELATLLSELDPPQPVVITHIGAVLGTHIGPHAIGICALTATP
jgi:DegV family protein with EDD domain